MKIAAAEEKTSSVRLQLEQHPTPDASPTLPRAFARWTALCHDGLQNSTAGCDQGKGTVPSRFLLCHGIFSGLSDLGSNARQITAALQPTRLEIHNDSHLHAHHAPMAGNTSTETHFRLIITSESFKSKMQPARHRMIYTLLKDELAAEGGIHALQLRTMTPEEEQRRKAAEEKKAADEQAA